MTSAMRAQRVTSGDLYGAQRERGCTGPERVLAVVLEADGSP
ncbi:hypothetical protein [Massilia glaciei]|nr:hypothetical protein [Massilia glaciei]